MEFIGVFNLPRKPYHVRNYHIGEINVALCGFQHLERGVLNHAVSIKSKDGLMNLQTIKSLHLCKKCEKSLNRLFSEGARS